MDPAKEANEQLRAANRNLKQVKSDLDTTEKEIAIAVQRVGSIKHQIKRIEDKASEVD